MISALAMALALSIVADVDIEVVNDGPVAPRRGALLMTNEAYEVVLGALLDVEIGGAAGLHYSIPRARLRADALVDTQIPAGMRLELEASPFFDPSSNLNGPGALRDAYLRLGVGNKKVIDLGEIRIGQMRVPSSAHSLRPPERWRFSRRPLAESELLPGRDLGFVYHIDYGSHGWPVRLWLGNFVGSGPNHVPTVVEPTVALRLEGDPISRVTAPLRLRSGVGLVVNSRDPRQPMVLALDLEATARRFNFEAAWLFAGQPSTLMAQGGLRVEAGLELLTDFLEVRLRHESTTWLGAALNQRLSIGCVLTYLDNAFQVLGDVTLPLAPGPRLGAGELVLTFRIWW